MYKILNVEVKNVRVEGCLVVLELEVTVDVANRILYITVPAVIDVKNQIDYYINYLYSVK